MTEQKNEGKKQKKREKKERKKDKTKNKTKKKQTKQKRVCRGWRWVSTGLWSFGLCWPYINTGFNVIGVRFSSASPKDPLPHLLACFDVTLLSERPEKGPRGLDVIGQCQLT